MKPGSFLSIPTKHQKNASTTDGIIQGLKTQTPLTINMLCYMIKRATHQCSTPTPPLTFKPMTNPIPYNHNHLSASTRFLT